MFRHSQNTQSLQFAQDPAIVAQACCDALQKVGNLKQVERTTGLISGKIGVGWNIFAGETSIVLRISRIQGGAQVDIQASAPEGTYSIGDSSQKGVMRFLTALAEDPNIQGTSASGW
jgi:hypothetical protein